MKNNDKVETYSMHGQMRNAYAILVGIDEEI
jgi:hypothetical protein